MKLNYMERFLNNKINIDKIRESSINVYSLKDYDEELKQYGFAMLL